MRTWLRTSQQVLLRSLLAWIALMLLFGIFLWGPFISAGLAIVWWKVMGEIA